MLGPSKASGQSQQRQIQIKSQVKVNQVIFLQISGPHQRSRKLQPIQVKSHIDVHQDKFKSNLKCMATGQSQV